MGSLPLFKGERRRRPETASAPTKIHTAACIPAAVSLSKEKPRTTSGTEQSRPGKSTGWLAGSLSDPP